ncbi:Wax ester synthase/diacylglycerol acyltransferase 4 [Linum grandiflorum]
MAAAFDEEGPTSMPVSPTGEYLSTSVFTLSIIAVLESETPLDDLQTRSLLRDLFLPISPRFSSVMVTNAKGVKKWRKVEVKLDDHIKAPKFPTNMSTDFYDKCLDKYLSNLGPQFPEGKPLWEVHIIMYPTSSAAGSIIFRLHHSLGDGYSLMGALLSCLKRADDPSLPLTFPSQGKHDSGCSVSGFVSSAINTVSDLCSKGGLAEDSKSAVRSGHDGVEFSESSIVTMDFSMDDVKQIKLKLGVTVNDVICGAIFLGVRIYMEGVDSGSGSSADTTSLVLLNTRMVHPAGYKSVKEMVKPGSELPWGNHFAFLLVSVPKLPNRNKADPCSGISSVSDRPLEFVLQTHEIVKRKRTSLTLYLTAKYLQLLRKLRGPEAVSRYLYDTMKNSSFGITNVIGPVEKMALANHPIKGLYFVVSGAPQSMAVSVMSYVNQLRVAVKVERDFIDSKKLKSCIEESFAKIYEAACGRKEIKLDV